MKRKTFLKFFLIANVIFLALQFNANCNRTDTKIVADVAVKKDSAKIFIKPPSSFIDTIIISTASVVFFKPDSLQLLKIKKLLPPMQFESIEHDCFSQTRNSKIVIKKYYPQLGIHDASHTRYILFTGKNNLSTIIDLDQKDIFGMILFTPEKSPEFVDMTNIETALSFYFR
ncbi:hypothetical protein BH09BAC2_BH09BAC2_16220 [soil metagenome]